MESGIGFGDYTGLSGTFFEARVSAGAYDLVMLTGDITSGYEQIAIRRDISITGDTELVMIDPFEYAPQPLVPVSFTASNLRPGEVQSSSVELYTSSTFAVLHLSGFAQPPGWDVPLAPEGVLRATERQFVSLFAAESSGERSHRRGIRRTVRVGDPTSVTLPEPLGPVTFEMTPDRSSRSVMRQTKPRRRR